MKTNVTPQEFVRAYIEAGGAPAEISRKTGLSYATVSQRVKSYRKHGVKLPKRRLPNGPRYDVDELNQLIYELRG